VDITALLSRWRADPTVGGNVVEWRSIPARTAHMVSFPLDLHPALVQSLKASDIESLYIHQAEAWRLAQDGTSLVVVTGTASGKTLCYNLPVLDRLIRKSGARALYLFPTKALGQDQLAGLKSIEDVLKKIDPDLPPLSPAIYDGDTPSSARPALRAKSRLIISNPDMLHTGILPHHTSWAEFFSSLEYVIIDEIHIYRGVFGSHVANVLRRLKRITQHYGANPRYILTSATISNPAELAGWLIEEPVALVDQDGSSRGPKNFLIYNPPVVDRDLGLRRSVLQETVRLSEDLLAYDVQFIIFGRTRRTVELILSYLRTRTRNMADGSRQPAPDAEPENSESVRGYRSGYLPWQRRSVERGLKEGHVSTVVATTALELGIDIGGMDAALLAGYPGTIAGTWQQAGRAGRGSDPSLAVMLTSASPLDQFLAHHPDYFFGRTPEQALINPDNLLILLGHLRCAAFELPFRRGENFGTVDATLLLEFLEYLRDEGDLHLSDESYFWMADRYPAEAISLRSASPEPVLLQTLVNNVWTTIGQVDSPSATWMVHPGAIYLHEAVMYLVEELDLEKKIAHLKATSVDYYTEPQSETSVLQIETMDTAETTGGSKAHGELLVTTKVTGFRKIKLYTHETLGVGEINLPQSDLQTTGYWVSIADALVDMLRDQGLWSSDRLDYGPNWRAQRDRARARDGYRCQACGVEERQREHDVHHKIPFRSFLREGGSQAIERAHQLSNLVTLCHNCHRRVETAVRIRSGLGGLAFVLGHLAPLFLMCDGRDLGVHSDPQAALADRKPTVVIYDQAPAGLGFSQRLFEIHDELMKTAYRLVVACECSEGCPSCVGPGGENGLGGKQETLALLKGLSTGA
jgi:DEAD/DEAH box helicase domain-containing protein